MYTPEQINSHIRAARKLDLIKDLAFDYIRKNIGQASEKDVEKFIFSEFKKHNLVKEKGGLIVAANENSASPHYFPKGKAKRIGKNCLVLIDIWARENKKNSVFADITWVGYVGKVPKDIQNIFDKVIFGRDLVLEYIKKELKSKNLPKTGVADKVVRDYFEKFQEHLNFIHKTGHSLGIVSPHGKHFRLSIGSKKVFNLNIPFTIEPGIYWKNKFGIRSEVDCFINKSYKLRITSKAQRAITIIQFL